MRKSPSAIGTEPGSRHSGQDLIHKVPKKIIFLAHDRVKLSLAIGL
ncbi:hypothetical protein NG796_15135 [Laspinema sp. A4]|nr:hypothetical protein [Laspinema sp. D2d]MCT7984632.1 hypothetical protein [Laspinema sp. D2d]